jgi:7-cyano-7-deazaguanine synthase
MKSGKKGEKVIVLLSGGLDSSTVLAIAKEKGYELYALTIDYGQRHKIEIENSKKIAKFYEAREHKILSLDLSLFGGSALTTNIQVPKKDSIDHIKKFIPVTYVPARNTVFLSLALSWADSISASSIFIGVNALDYSGYPDCREEFLKSFQTTARLGTRSGTEGNQEIKIHAPLLHLTKAEIIKLGLSLGVDYSNTFTCYDPIGQKACGRCDACLLRLKGFKENYSIDPVSYLNQGNV